jgi:hypothetical protein
MTEQQHNISMKTIDKRVLDIEKADFNTKFEHERALKMNVVKRVLNTPDEKFELVTSDCVRLELNNDIKIKLYEVNADAEITIYQNDAIIDSFFYKDPYRPSYMDELGEKDEHDSDCELLRNKIKSIRKIKLEVTEESKKYMSEKTKRFYAAFDAISEAL